MLFLYFFKLNISNFFYSRWCLIFKILKRDNENRVKMKPKNFTELTFKKNDSDIICTAVTRLPYFKKFCEFFDFLKHFF